MANEITALSTVGEFNAHHREALKAGQDFMENGIACGLIATDAKAGVPHGEWESWVEQYYDCSLRATQHYMKLYRNLAMLPKAQRAALLKDTDSLRGLTAALSRAAPKPDVPTTKVHDAPVHTQEPSGRTAGSPVSGPAAAEYDDTELDESSESDSLIAIPETPVSWFEQFTALWDAADDLGRTTIRAFFMDDQKKPTGFVQPTLDEVTAYCDERGKGIDPEAWLAHYRANGWKVGSGSGKPMRDWKSAVITWEKMKSSGVKSTDPRGNQATLEAYIERL